MQFVALYLGFQHNISTFLMYFARLAVVIYMLPVLGSRVLSNLIIKNTIIALIIIGLWPCFGAVIEPEQGEIVVLLKEFIIGLILAITLSLPFWIINSVGELLDNQRGATISDSIDPVNGTQSSILSGFLSFAFGALFFASHGMERLMDAIIQSYQIFPRGRAIEGIHWQQTGQLILVLVKDSIMLAAPVMLVMMISEILLGVFARYCPQLNPFSLSLTIKTSIALAVFLLYGFWSFTETPLHIFSIGNFQKFFI
ncbi:type III secretion system export apparatus subunit SctT [Pantoea agglomerans]|uniref:type III secretion system export apparatus subunit SctT n=1 Tax=Enterobacter agglomerans TaxID=549 RepID=UPI0013BE4AC5|nr:type III secretion system export apparatus subunit SctT [Pantoea agglomerans]NEG59851.1 EscT/YscT/HrcT family type III secretion system export apparatus protein [Pantoea agglomerans]NEG98820.1 EscT/YscT/HrcT family type III secretion system export apparatus protein [Pantoea agglomerans]NEH05196.1 EscT/YscT/HrcT family type III secretion system export apparatus protein [Pantoea agglomerans]NEH16185.1 EscT/YscT/HrcT family type III secretion system export apparatus protein [Pantoea agglomerans